MYYLRDAHSLVYIRLYKQLNKVQTELKIKNSPLVAILQTEISVKQQISVDSATTHSRH